MGNFHHEDQRSYSYTQAQNGDSFSPFTDDPCQHLVIRPISFEPPLCVLQHLLIMTVLGGQYKNIRKSTKSV